MPRSARNFGFSREKPRIYQHDGWWICVCKEFMGCSDMIAEAYKIWLRNSKGI